MEALVRYTHAAAGFPVKSTWLKAIKHGNYNSWPGLTYNNAAKYFPESVETIKGHMVQSSQEVRSTKIPDTIKLRSLRKLSNIINNQTQRKFYRNKKRKKFTYGTNLSANYTLMIAIDSPLGQEVEMSTS